MTDFSRYLIASDIDGTYLSYGGSELVQRNIDALEHFRAGGGLFTLSTGRIACTMDPGIPMLRETINAPAVLSNGAVLYDFHKDECYDETLIDEQDVNEILQLLLSIKLPGEHIQLSARNAMYFDESNEAIERYVAPAKPGTIHFSAPDTWPRDTVYKLIAHGSDEKMAALRQTLKERFGDRIGTTASAPRSLEIQTGSCNKAVGLEKLRRHVGEDRILIACGDYLNDLEMLMAADISVCPANAHEKVKAICDYELCHCKDGLIADIIEKIEAGELTVPPHKRRVK